LDGVGAVIAGALSLIVPVVWGVNALVGAAVLIWGVTGWVVGRASGGADDGLTTPALAQNAGECCS
jgi:hypothetical protein